MPKFDVTLSSMTEAATNIRNHGEEFKTAADELKTATENLTTSSEGWSSEASQIFNENIAEAHQWMTEMSAIVEEYSQMLEKARDTYENADITSAKNFSK